MLKNQHLLAGLVVLGAVNVLAFFGLISGERDSARTIQSLRQELTVTRDEQEKGAERLGREADRLRQELDGAHATIAELRGDVGKLQNQLTRTRRALDAVEERLDKPAPREGGKE
jgi:uncharacterized coiled-coil DUF342 family protein